MGHTLFSVIQAVRCDWQRCVIKVYRWEVVQRITIVILITYFYSPQRQITYIGKGGVNNLLAQII